MIITDTVMGRRVETDCGDYTILNQILDEGRRDTSLNLYIGRDDAGQCELIASDNASLWVVGDADDANTNRDHWVLISEHCDVERVVIATVRDIDPTLADGLAALYRAA